VALVATAAGSARTAEFVVILDFSLGFFNEIECILLRQDYSNTTSYDAIRFHPILLLFGFGLRLCECLKLVTQFAVLLFVVAVFVVVGLNVEHHARPLVHDLLRKILNSLVASDSLCILFDNASKVLTVLEVICGNLK